MAWETYSGNAGNGDYEQEEREWISFKIGTTAEGALDAFGKRKPSRFDDGEELAVFWTGTDGVKYFGIARKVVLERFDAARLAKGDRFKLDIVKIQPEKQGAKAYGSPTLLVDRASGEAASQAAEMPAEAPKSAPASPVPDLDDPPF